MLAASSHLVFLEPNGLTSNPAYPSKHLNSSISDCSSPYTIEVDTLASRIFGKSVGNCCWHYFNLAKSCSCYTYNSYKTTLALFKFCKRTKNRQTTKLKSSLNKLCIRYSMPGGGSYFLYSEKQQYT